MAILEGLDTALILDPVEVCEVEIGDDDLLDTGSRLSGNAVHRKGAVCWTVDATLRESAGQVGHQRKATNHSRRNAVDLVFDGPGSGTCRHPTCTTPVVCHVRNDQQLYSMMIADRQVKELHQSRSPPDRFPLLVAPLLAVAFP